MGKSKKAKPKSASVIGPDGQASPTVGRGHEEEIVDGMESLWHGPLPHAALHPHNGASRAVASTTSMAPRSPLRADAPTFLPTKPDAAAFPKKAGRSPGHGVLQMQAPSAPAPAARLSPSKAKAPRQERETGAAPGLTSPPRDAVHPSHGMHESSEWGAPAGSPVVGSPPPVNHPSNGTMTSEGLSSPVSRVLKTGIPLGSLVAPDPAAGGGAQEAKEGLAAIRGASPYAKSPAVSSPLRALLQDSASDTAFAKFGGAPGPMDAAGYLRDYCDSSERLRGWTREQTGEGGTMPPSAAELVKEAQVYAAPMQGADPLVGDALGATIALAGGPMDTAEYQRDYAASAARLSEWIEEQEGVAAGGQPQDGAEDDDAGSSISGGGGGGNVIKGLAFLPALLFSSVRGVHECLTETAVGWTRAAYTLAGSVAGTAVGLTDALLHLPTIAVGASPTKKRSGLREPLESPLLEHGVGHKLAVEEAPVAGVGVGGVMPRAVSHSSMSTGYQTPPDHFASDD
eukprot:jgi/Mesvir1/2730/Mv22252-RA.1